MLLPISISIDSSSSPVFLCEAVIRGNTTTRQSPTPTPPPSTRIRYEQMAKSGGGSLRTMLAADQEKLEQGNTAMHFLYAKPPGLAEASGSVGSLGGSLRGSVVSGSVGGWVGRFFSLLPFVRVSMGLGVVYLSVGGSGI